MHYIPYKLSIFIISALLFIPLCLQAKNEQLAISIGYSLRCTTLDKTDLDSITPNYIPQLNIAIKAKTSNNAKPIVNQKLSFPLPAFLISAALSSYGVLAQFAPPLKNLDRHTQQSVSKHVLRSYRIDDYIQYAPAIGIYALDIAGIKAKHNFRDRTIIMATSHLILCATVQTMKHTINVKRPDGSNQKSFPSGHTGTAFVGAHILLREYGEVSPWIGIGGYAIATTTGALRVINKKHWVSDVVTGAGIGILTAEIGYLLLPTIHQLFGIKSANKNIITPTIENNAYGLKFSKSF